MTTTTEHKTAAELCTESTRHIMADTIAQLETKVARLERSLRAREIEMAEARRDFSRACQDEARLLAAVDQCKHAGLRILATIDWAELLSCYGGNGQEAAEYVAELAGKSDKYEAADVVREWEERK